MGADVAVLAGITEPDTYPIDDSMIIKPLPAAEAAKIEIVRGPNIAPLPVPEAPEQHLECRVSLKTADNITTDDITQAAALSGLTR